ncbi:MAG: hypothetical protein QNK70_08470 [Crocinitomicaceae bacterium]
MTVDSTWVEVHSRGDGSQDILHMERHTHPLLLRINNEPVIGIVFNLYPNGNIGHKKHYKNGL